MHTVYDYLFSTTSMIYSAAALVPAIVLLIFVYRHDKVEKEPASLLLKLLLLGGGASVVFALVGESILQGGLNALVAPYSQEILYNLLLAFVVVACVEEGGKLLFLKLLSWNSPHFNYVFDAVVYSAFVSLGFAAIENVKYVFAYGLEVALARAITAVPAHLSFSILMGVFYGRAKLCQVCEKRVLERKNLALAYLVPVFFHGTYDACCMIQNGVTVWLFLVFVIVMYVLVFRLLRRAAKYDRPLV